MRQRNGRGLAAAAGCSVSAPSSEHKQQRLCVLWQNSSRSACWGGLKVKSLKSISSTFKCSCVRREPCRVAEGKNEGEAGPRDTQESQRAVNHFSTTAATPHRRSLWTLHRLKGLRMSFFLLSSPVLGAKRCSYAKSFQKTS